MASRPSRTICSLFVFVQVTICCERDRGQSGVFLVHDFSQYPRPTDTCGGLRAMPRARRSKESPRNLPVRLIPVVSVEQQGRPGLALVPVPYLVVGG